MDWIKKNAEKFTLLLLALGLLVASIFLFLGAQTFKKSFDPLMEPVLQGNKLPRLETQPLEAAQASLEKPSIWTHSTPPLLVAAPYVLDENGNPLEVKDVPLIAPDGTKVPYEWLNKYHLNNLNTQTLDEDPDGDRFTNLEEFKGGTDPTDKNSHSAYWTKLRLAEFIKVKFSIIFQGQPDDDSFQINTVDVNQPTQILKMGDAIPNTKYKIIKFEKKIATDPESGIEHDNSELTIQGTDPAAPAIVVLVKNRIVDAPESYAKFRYLWDGTEFTVKKGQDFSFKPETDVTYKLIDINGNEAKIHNLKTNEDFTIPRPK